MLLQELYDKYAVHIPVHSHEMFLADLRSLLNTQVYTAANLLNVMYEADPVTMSHLTTDLRMCSPALASSSAEVVALNSRLSCIGLLGVVNGLFPESQIRIVPMLDNNNNIPADGKVFSVPLIGFNIAVKKDTDKVVLGKAHGKE